MQRHLEIYTNGVGEQMAMKKEYPLRLALCHLLTYQGMQYSSPQVIAIGAAQKMIIYGKD